MGEHFDEEQLQDLYAVFPDLRVSGSIQNDDVREALGKLGCPIAGHELRQIQGTVVKGVAPCSIDELYNIYARARAIKIEPMQIRKDDFLKEAPPAKVCLSICKTCSWLNYRCKNHLYKLVNMIRNDVF